ncbi:MAG: TrkA family potassium uptake protein [Deltaproteobacteria bacterium]|nr:TrkA family potassium uptake protein [Deltaproteobacteria bacterium]
MSQIAVIGLGSFGYKIATSLASMGAEVIAIDINPSLVEDIKERVHHAVVADSSDEKTLRSIGVSEVDAAVNAIGENIEISIMTTVVLRRLGVGKIVSRAISPTHAEVLREIGASQVVQIEEQMGEQIARSLAAANVSQHIHFPAGYTLIEMESPRSFFGKTLRDLELREKYGVLCVAIQRKVPTIDDKGHSFLKSQVQATPNPSEKINENDVLVLVGSDSGIEEVLELK